jgi:DNA-directed RNA polymerase subunit RPC12/RpoP
MPMTPCSECGMTFPPNDEGLEMMLQHLHLRHGAEEVMIKKNGHRIASLRVKDEEWTEFTIYDEKGRPVHTWNVEDEEWTEITKYDENGGGKLKYYCMTCGEQHNQLACPKCGSNYLDRHEHTKVRNNIIYWFSRYVLSSPL